MPKKQPREPKQLDDKRPTTYRVQARCTNCNRTGAMTLPVGMRLADSVCPVCRCPTLTIER